MVTSEELTVFRALWGTVVSPLRTFSELERDRYAARHGALVLAFVSLVYTFILIVFIRRGYPAAAPSVLRLPVEAQYRLQIWYQAPLFFASTALTAWLLTAVSRLTGGSSGFETAFGRIALATAAPFAWTTMLVEAGVALLMALHVLAPMATLQWLTGSGAWFAMLYQFVGLVWLVALVILAVRATGRPQWWKCVLGGIGLVTVYALPVALLIR